LLQVNDELLAKVNALPLALPPALLALPARASVAGRCQGHAIGIQITDFLCTTKEAHHQTGRHFLRSQHLEQKEYGQERTKYLESQGYKIIRFWNNEVMSNIEGVILAVMNALEE
jgi:very-short-patch-repair endonuclease